MSYAYVAEGNTLYAVNPVTFEFESSYTMPYQAERLGVDPVLRKVYTVAVNGLAAVLEADSGEIVNLGALVEASFASTTSIVVNPNNHYVYFMADSPGLLLVYNGHNYDYIDTLVLPNASAIAMDPLTNLLYVAYEDGIAIINGTTLQTVDLIESPALVWRIPSIAIDPCLGRLYAASDDRASLVAVDLVTRSVLNEVPLSGPATKLIADQRQGILYVLDISSSLNRYNSCTLDFVSSSWPALGALDIALDQMSGLLYVPSSSSANLVVIDSQSANIFRSIGNGIPINQAAVLACTPACARFSCDDRSGFIPSSALPGYAFTQDAYTGLIYRIRPDTLQIDRTINVGGQPTNIAADPELRQLYIPNNEAGLLDIINADSASVLASLEISGADQAVVNPITHKVYLTAEEQIVEVDGLRREISDAIAFDTNNLSELKINPVNNCLYYIYSVGTSYSVVQFSFNARQIVRQWSFPAGDNLFNLLINECNGSVYVLLNSGDFRWIKLNQNGSTTEIDLTAGPTGFSTDLDSARNLLFSYSGTNLILYDLCACEIRDTIPLPETAFYPRNLTIDSANQLLYLAYFESGLVYVYDAVTLNLLQLISDSATPYSVATVSPRNCAPCNCGCCDDDTTLLAQSPASAVSAAPAASRPAAAAPRTPATPAARTPAAPAARPSAAPIPPAAARTRSPQARPAAGYPLPPRRIPRP